MDTNPTRYEALLACLAKAGSISQLGRDLGIPQSTASRMVNSSKQLRADLVIEAEARYGVSRYYLRPDYYPPREAMTDRGTPDRFCGIDRNIARPVSARPSFADLPATAVNG